MKSSSVATASAAPVPALLSGVSASAVAPLSSPSTVVFNTKTDVHAPAKARKKARKHRHAASSHGSGSGKAKTLGVTTASKRAGAKDTSVSVSGENKSGDHADAATAAAIEVAGEDAVAAVRAAATRPEAALPLAASPLAAGTKYPIKQQSFKIARDKERKEKLRKNLGEDRVGSTSPTAETLKSRNHRVFLAPPRHAAAMPERPSWRSLQASVNTKPSTVAEELHAEIIDYAEYTQTTVREMAVHIEEMIENVRTSVTALWSKAQVEPFGSYSTGIWLPSSDVDLVILGVVEIHNRMLTIKFLKQLAQALEAQTWAESIVVLESAKIPVLKLVTAESSVPIDITFESTATHSGLLARDLIRKYANEMPELYPLAIVFKQLLRERDLNDAYTGGLSSYSIVLMIIHFQLLWRGGGYCFQAASMFAAGHPLPRPADLVKQGPPPFTFKTIKPKEASLPAKTQTSSSDTSTTSTTPVPTSTPVSSYAAIVAKAKEVPQSQPKAPSNAPTSSSQQPFSYAAVAAGTAKLPRATVPKPPCSYAAAVATTKTQSAPRPTQIVRMPIVLKTLSGASVELAKDSISISSSVADTEDLSSCSDSPPASNADETDEAENIIDQISLGDLTMNILEFFGITFDFRKNGISVRDGGYIYRLAEPTDLGKKLPPLVIEDPIHPDRNVSASSFAFSKVVAVLEDSFYALKYFHPTKFTPTALSCLLSVSGHTRHSSKHTPTPKATAAKAEAA